MLIKFWKGSILFIETKREKVIIVFDSVLEIFKKLCSIPHGSGNIRMISDYCIQFAKSHSLKVISDEAGNVIIFKDGTNGYENSPAVILQGHLDMVCVKTDETQIDFETQGLTVAEDDEFIWAKGTSLGGDDGIAVAYALAVLADDKISDPPLEVVLTVDEEVGMLGAQALDTSILKAKRLINIDSEEEDTLLVSCAGGVRADIDLPIMREAEFTKAISVTISGFTGGHSGTEIDKGRLNAIITMAKLLSAANVSRIASIDGGSADNAIAVYCKAVIADTGIKDILCSEFEKIKASCQNTDPDITMIIDECDAYQMMDKDSSRRLLSLLNQIPNGVISFSDKIQGLVQTSLNLGIINTSDKSVLMCHALRSSVEAEKELLSEKVKNCASRFGGNIKFYAGYPAWEYNEKSELRRVICSSYEKLHGSKMKVASIHAGLECGLFCGKIKGLDCVSMGPDIFDIHTTDEKLSKGSAERFFYLLLDVLAELK